MNEFITMLKREYWENKKLFIRVPVRIMLLMMVLYIASLIFIPNAMTDALPTLETPEQQQMGREIADEIEDKFGLDIDSEEAKTQAARWEKGSRYSAFLFSLDVVVLTIAWFIGFYYLARSLYEDRRDGSILFWKSLPSSEAKVVLAKFATAAITVPVISMVVLAVGYFLALVITQISGLFVASQSYAVFWFEGDWWRAIQFWFEAFPKWSFSQLSSVGFMGWALLVSCYVRKSPLLIALLPVVFLYIIAPVAAVALGELGGHAVKSVIKLTPLGGGLNHATLFSSWYFYVQAVVGVAMVFFAIKIRRSKSGI